ncbi:MAG TPA: EAL domain-containing protein [Polyangiales bacterium]|nr:EAL domain-containing protein [Polyangiales bacterium]
MTEAESAKRQLGLRPRVLLVHDEPPLLVALRRAVGDDFETVTASSISRALDLLRLEPEFSVVIAGQRTDANGEHVLVQIAQVCDSVRILLGAADPNAVIHAVNRAGVFAVLATPLDELDVRLTLKRAVEHGAALRDQRLFTELLESAPDAIFFKDRELRYLRANRACAALHRASDPAGLRGLREKEANPPAGGGVDLETDQRAVIASGVPSVDQLSSYELDGTTRWLSTMHAPLRDPRGEITGLVGIARDITERKLREDELTRSAAQLNFLAHYDELTQLPKRELLMDRLAQRLAANPPGGSVALVLIDIERFRRINVSLGRSAGDELLFAVVSRLRPMLGVDDTLARFDGNTFAWLIAEARDASFIANKLEHDILPRLRAPYQLEEAELRISCRVAIAIGPSDGDDAEQLTRHAEAALHKAGAASQPYVFYAPIMNERVAERLALETRLRRAIEKEEFVLYYQPKLELKTGKIAGLEALIRWQDPEQGLIQPGAFIPVLEETGLILDVGRWVFRAAAEQYVRWRDQGLSPPPIAVNVSSLELGQSDFLQAIEQSRSDFPRADGGVELEITESVLMDDLHGNIEKLRSVRESGLRIAIDDFGTGYSSLGYLSRLPIDALKVDRSFVTRMTEDPQDMTIVMMIISLAHALDLKVIAEGPETVQQAQLLRLLKCDQIQGYVVARPQPANQVAELLGKTLSFAPGATGAH